MLKFIYKNYRPFFISTAIILCLSTFNAFANPTLEPLTVEIKRGAKTAIITGSNRGQGLGWVKHFLKKGYQVIATARKPEKSTALIELKKEYKKHLIIQKLDVTSEFDMKSLATKLKAEDIKIDVAISNAGVTIEEDFGNWTAKGIETNFRVNTMGAALFAQAIAPYLKDGAKLIQLSSGAGSITYQKRSSPLDAYRISKAGLNMLTRNLSARLEDRKIIVVSINPGGVLTDMNPNGKLSVTEAIAIMSETISKLTIKDSGTFINNDGKVMPW
ncbi:SDR family oxidoreductase [uncultured Algibacter sp.]|uniref:SDR family oxidoreductase n=1 Tax=uncultured Algibacter sp. TaxID=298659 RepID=UPI00261D67E9|nr:SDR family oxidoreductase [uncultured Algibacter sp.]